MPRSARASLAGPRYAIPPSEFVVDTFPAVVAATSTVVQVLAQMADSSFFDASFNVSFTRPAVRSHNIVAMVPGSDPRLTSEIIVLSAYADHAGIADSADRVGGDSVINGANVGGSGAVALLEIGEYLRSLEEQPRRSVVLLWVVGSEHGSLGATWFTANLPVMPNRTVVAHVSVDMLGRPAAESGATAVSVIGSRDVSRDLAAWISEVAARPQFGVRADYQLDDDPLGARLRCSSAHPHFARRGIPSAFITAGPSGDYKTVTDEVERIDLAQYERATRFVAGVVLDLANNPSRPMADSVQSVVARGCPWSP
jgi:Zn-dependent M28 family amino/carboxypeptidase